MVRALQVRHDAKLVEAEFRDVLDSTPHFVVMLNITGRNVLVNSQVEKVFEYD